MSDTREIAEKIMQRCPTCKQMPTFLIEEEAFGDSGETWTVVHICTKGGLSVNEGPCLSKSDAVDAWHMQIGADKVRRGHERQDRSAGYEDGVRDAIGKVKALHNSAYNAVITALESLSPATTQAPVFTELERLVIEAAVERRATEVAMFPFSQTPSLSFPQNCDEGQRLLEAFIAEQKAVDDLITATRAQALAGRFCMEDQ